MESFHEMLVADEIMLCGLVLVAGLVFFYAPIVSVILFSFNASTSATLWSGFSLRWYRELLNNDDILRAARLSLTMNIREDPSPIVVSTTASMVNTLRIESMNCSYWI